MASRCIICLEDGCIKHTFPCACSGFFHEPCLQNWYRQTGSHTCPICRIPFRQYRIQSPERVVTYNPVYVPPQPSQPYVPPQNYATIPIYPAPSAPPYPVTFQNMTPTERAKRIVQAVCLGGMLMIPFGIFYIAVRDNW
jgi:hypothetical protein